MSATAGFDRLLDERGVRQDLGSFVVAACFDRSSRHAAFALGDGTVRLADLAARETWRPVEAHDGAVLALAPDAVPGAFLTGGDDGLFRRIDAAGDVDRHRVHSARNGSSRSRARRATRAGKAACAPAPPASSCICSMRRARS